MGTPCKIIVKSGNHYRGIGVHYDGYLEGVGVTLFRHYTSDEKVQQLISLGDLQVLDANIGIQFDATDEHLRAIKKSERQCIAYHRDYGRSLHISDGPTLEDACDGEYHGYFWDGENWSYLSYGKPLALLKNLIPIQQAPDDTPKEEFNVIREIETYILKRVEPLPIDKRIEVAEAVSRFLNVMLNHKDN